MLAGFVKCQLNPCLFDAPEHFVFTPAGQGDKHGLSSDWPIAHAPRRFEPVHSRHANVEEDQLRFELGGCRETLDAAIGDPNLRAQGLEQHCKAVGDFRHIVDDQHPPRRGRGARPRLRRPSLHLEFRGQWQTHDEATAASFAFAVRLDLAAMQLHEASHEREPYAETSRIAAQRSVRLHK